MDEIIYDLQYRLHKRIRSGRIGRHDGLSMSGPTENKESQGEHSKDANELE
jgi:hypothetical protein